MASEAAMQASIDDFASIVRDALSTFKGTPDLPPDEQLQACFDGFYKASLHRHYLKLGARHRAVGDVSSAEAWRKVAETYGEEASQSLDEAATLAQDLTRFLAQQTAGNDLKAFAQNGQLSSRLDQALEKQIKPATPLK